MPDVPEAIGKALELVQKLRAAAERINEPEIKFLVADLMLTLSDVKVQTVALHEESAALRRQIDAAREKSDLRSKLQLRDGMYFLAEPPAGKSEGPYCTHCLDAKDKYMLLSRVTPDLEVFGTHVCPACKNFYGKGKTPYL